MVDAAVAAAHGLAMKRVLISLAMAALSLGGLPAAAAVPVCKLSIVKRFPHDRGAFTQGLLFHDGHLYESTGLFGASSIRKVDLASGRVLKQAPIAQSYFGEGLTLWRQQLISLTWQNQAGFRWDLATLAPRGQFSYRGEGWGLANDGRHLILSDGSPILKFHDPASFAPMRTLLVTGDGGVPVPQLNELEWVDGAILANVWQTNLIARIDPASGRVTAWLDAAAISRQAGTSDPDDVLNGIAWDARGGRLFITGKRWPSLFQVAVKGPGCPSIGR